MLPVFAHIHRPLRLNAAKEREQATTSPLNLPRSSFAAAVAAKNEFIALAVNKIHPLTATSMQE